MSKLLLTIAGENSGVVYEIEAFEVTSGMTESVDTVITLHGVVSSVEIESLDTLPAALDQSEGGVVNKRVEEPERPSSSGIVENVLLDNNTILLAGNPRAVKLLDEYRVKESIKIAEDYDENNFRTILTKVILKTTPRMFVTERFEITESIMELVMLEKFNSNGQQILFTEPTRLVLTDDQQNYFLTETFNVVQPVELDKIENKPKGEGKVSTIIMD